jgi:hypothetical protein
MLVPVFSCLFPISASVPQRGVIKKARLGVMAGSVLLQVQGSAKERK